MKNSKSQKEKFIDKARELDCDEDKRVFDDKLKRLAKAKPKKKETPDK